MEHLLLSFFTIIQGHISQMCWNIQSNLDISKLMGLYFTSSNYPKCKFIALRVIWTCKKVSNAKLLLEKAIKMFFFIQIDTSNFAEFEISEFEISRVDCIK